MGALGIIGVVLGAVIGTATAVTGILIAALDLRDRLWPKPTTPHPLAAPLADIAAAIREQRGEA
jgi:hypothetical protein